MPSAASSSTSPRERSTRSADLARSGPQESPPGCPPGSQGSAFSLAGVCDYREHGDHLRPGDGGEHYRAGRRWAGDLPANGYVEREFLASGTASAYDPVGEAGSDGRWVAQACGTAPFCTRVVVRRPADPARFSGTLLLEWLNVSGGFDADPDWAFVHEEIFRQGHAYAAVSAQARGVLGGKAQPGFPLPPSPGLRASEPVRYGSLAHPGDQYAFDIFGQIGRALKAASPALGGLVPARVLALGDSQSAVYLTSYINAVHRLSPAFDGFLVHSRGADAAPLSGAGIDPAAVTVGVRIRADNRTPVLILESEGDIVAPLSFGLAASRLRLAPAGGNRRHGACGRGHPRAEQARLLGVDWRINQGPHRFLAQAALHALHRWVGEGTPPPRAARIELASQQPLVIARRPVRHRARRRAHAFGGRAGCHAQRPGSAGRGRPWLAGRLDHATGRRDAAAAPRRQVRLTPTPTSARSTRRSGTASCCPRTGRSFSPRQRPSPSRPPLGADTDLGSA